MLSDEVAVMHKGKLEQVGPPEDIYLRPRTRFVANFLGAVNWMGGFGVRPEATRIATQAPAAPARSVEATLKQSMFLGNLLHVEAVTTQGHEVVAEISRLGPSLTPGQKVWLWWNPADELHLPEEPQ